MIKQRLRSNLTFFYRGQLEIPAEEDWCFDCLYLCCPGLPALVQFHFLAARWTPTQTYFGGRGVLEMVSLCNNKSGLELHSIDQTGLQLRNPPACVSLELGLKACAIMPAFIFADRHFYSYSSCFCSPPTCCSKKTSYTQSSLGGTQLPFVWFHEGLRVNR